MFDWILSQNCRNALPLQRADHLARNWKNLDTVVPNQLLAANIARCTIVIRWMEEYKNSGLVVILHCLNSFQQNNYVAFLLYVLLRENHKINAVCLHLFHNGCQSYM